MRRKHLRRYLAEFDFRYNNRIAPGVDDHGRAARALGGVKASASPTKHLVQGEKPYDGNRPSTGPKPKEGGGAKAGTLSQEEQSERFKQTARELEADESGADLLPQWRPFCHPKAKANGTEIPFAFLYGEIPQENPNLRWSPTVG